MRRILVSAAVLTLVANADTLRLRSGRTVEGTYLGGDSRNVRFDTGDRVQTFAINDVSGIRFGSADDTTKSESSDARPLTPVAPARPAPPENAVASEAVTASNNAAEIPQGTALVIRLIDDVDSQRDSIGQTYKASVDEPITVGERNVIPRGADVIIKLIEDKESGKLTGKTELTLDVVSVQVNGRMVDVNTQEVTQSSGSRTGKTTKVVGGTAALGAIIGAIAGGGKGAAIGALSGAAAGGAVQVITKGEKVKIPSETRLTFTLEQPLRV